MAVSFIYMCRYIIFVAEGEGVELITITCFKNTAPGAVRKRYIV